MYACYCALEDKNCSTDTLHVEELCLVTLRNNF